MKAIIGALMACHAAGAAFAADPSYWFLLRYQDNRWCGYADRGAFLAANEKTEAWSSAEAQYREGELATLVHQIASESGDWEIIDTYRFGQDGIDLERVSTRVAPFYRIVRSARIGGTRPKDLHQISIVPEGVGSAEIADGPIPDIPIQSSIKGFPFLKLVPALQSGHQQEVCAR